MKEKATLLTTTLFFAFSNIAVYAQDFSQADNAKTFSGVFVVIARLVNLLLGLGGVVFIVMIFMMAIKFATSVDDPRGLEAAKQTGTNAIIGFVVVLGFFFIFNAILSAFGFTAGSGLDSPVSSGQSAVENLLHWFTTTEGEVIQYPTDGGGSGKTGTFGGTR